MNVVFFLDVGGVPFFFFVRWRAGGRDLASNCMIIYSFGMDSRFELLPRARATSELLGCLARFFFCFVVLVLCFCVLFSVWFGEKLKGVLFVAFQRVQTLTRV